MDNFLFLTRIIMTLIFWGSSLTLVFPFLLIFNPSNNQILILLDNFIMTITISCPGHFRDYEFTRETGKCKQETSKLSINVFECLMSEVKVLSYIGEDLEPIVH